MLDEARRLVPEDGDYIEFKRAGTQASGAFHCSSCGYGVSVQASLPQCPMCSGTTWELAPSSATAPRDPLQ